MMLQTNALPDSIGDNFILRLQVHPICRKINAFFLSPVYFLLIGALTVAASVFSAELIVYTCFILLGLYVSFCGKDYLPLMPVVVCCYIAPSVANNPGMNENSIFFPQNGGIYLMCLAGLFVLSLILRLCMDPEIGRRAFFSCKRKLLPSMLILGGAYLMSGAFSGHYFDNGVRSILFAFIQFVSVFLLYFVLTGAVKWEDVPRDYIAWTGLCIGFVILCQLTHIYISHCVIVDGEILRERIYSGWGTYNNVGALLTMMIPFAFQLACSRKRGLIYHLCALAFLFGVVMTCSRGSILVAIAIYVLSYSIVIYKDLHTKSSVLIHFITIIVVGLLIGFFHKDLYQLFHVLIDRGLDPSNRIEIYLEGLKQFLKHPIFGGTFYATDYVPYEFSNIAAFSSFFPPRWHNTVVQLLASSGIVGLIAYGYHRLGTLMLFAKKPTLGKAFIALSIMALLGTSMLDCHFFNVGPTLFYSMALAFAEKANTRQDNW